MRLESMDLSFDAIKIHPSFKNSRINLGPSSELQHHLLNNGLWHPLFVWEVESAGVKDYFLIAGFRRYNAIKGLRVSDPGIFPSVPVKVYRGDIKGAAQINLGENTQREDLNPVEVCRYLGWLKSLGMQQVEMSELLSKSEGYVSDGLNFLERADCDLIDAVEKEGMSYKVAMKVSRKLTKPQQAKAVRMWRKVAQDEGKTAANKSVDASLQPAKKTPKIKALRDAADLISLYNHHRAMDMSSLSDEDLAFLKGLLRGTLYALNHDIDVSLIALPELQRYEPPQRTAQAPKKS